MKFYVNQLPATVENLAKVMKLQDELCKKVNLNDRILERKRFFQDEDEMKRQIAKIGKENIFMYDEDDIFLMDYVEFILDQAIGETIFFSKDIDVQKNDIVEWHTPSSNLENDYLVLQKEDGTEAVYELENPEDYEEEDDK